MKSRCSSSWLESSERLRAAARDQAGVIGLTHGFYRYPARFSPQFAAATIEQFTECGDVVLDPFAGGGTAIVEAIARGRVAVGNDINTLAVFVSRVKTTPLTTFEMAAIRRWAAEIKTFRCASKLSFADVSPGCALRNLDLPRARYIKKIIGLSVVSTDVLPTASAREFARCVILKAAQWALDARKRAPSVQEFRDVLAKAAEEMLNGLELFVVSGHSKLTKDFVRKQRTLIHGDASVIHEHSVFLTKGVKAKLVLTSPPYPGVHVLYHRWQVDGRKETRAPYWIANCEDGAGESYYTFGSRQAKGLNSYFATSLRSLQSIRKVIHSDGIFVQLIAFSNPKTHLPRYLRNMKRAGFREIFLGCRKPLRRASRIWRLVPNRKWHATLKGPTASSREVVLIHKPV
jgi:hypothetical protein